LITTSTVLLPEPLAGKSPAGTGFQVSLEIGRFVIIGKREKGDKLPGVEFGGVG
jgi:hypothetical protein